MSASGMISSVRPQVKEKAKMRCGIGPVRAGRFDGLPQSLLPLALPGAPAKAAGRSPVGLRPRVPDGNALRAPSSALSASTKCQDSFAGVAPEDIYQTARQPGRQPTENSVREHTGLMYRYAGRQFRLANVYGEVVKDLLV